MASRAYPLDPLTRKGWFAEPQPQPHLRDLSLKAAPLCLKFNARGAWLCATLQWSSLEAQLLPPGAATQQSVAGRGGKGV